MLSPDEIKATSGSSLNSLGPCLARTVRETCFLHCEAPFKRVAGGVNVILLVKFAKFTRGAGDLKTDRAVRLF